MMKLQKKSHLLPKFHILDDSLNEMIVVARDALINREHFRKATCCHKLCFLFMRMVCQKIMCFNFDCCFLRCVRCTR